MTFINKKDPAKAQQEQHRQRILYLQNLRRIEQSEKKAQAVMEDYKKRAVEAARAGRHDEAVKMALEAKRMEQRVLTTATVKNTVETAHAMNETNAAMLQIMKSGSNALGCASGMMNPEELYEAQIGMDMTMDQIRLASEQQNDILDSLSPGESAYCPEGEAALAKLMANAAKPKTEKKLVDTARILDSLHPVNK